jgi:hypothetical protein
MYQIKYNKKHYGSYGNYSLLKMWRGLFDHKFIISSGLSCDYYCVDYPLHLVRQSAKS